MAGKVYLVGAGPGSAGLITVRGRELLSRAEVLVFDAPCDEALLAHVPAVAERIPVGRWPDAVKICQPGICSLLVERARTGRIVVRLKAGDPYMFGRGGEEAEALAQAGIAFEVIPGVTCGLAAAAWAGIPFTQRGLSSQVTFLIAQSSPQGWGLDLDALAKSEGTLVIHLDPAAIGDLARELVRRGRAGQTPVAVVESAGCPGERTFVGTLETIGEKAQGAKPPAVAFVGEAVSRVGQLGWAERRPLAGKCVVLTRPRAQAAEMAALLEENGAEVLEVPCIAIAAPESFQALDQAIADLSRFSWVIFSSSNGVERFFERLAFHGKDLRALATCKLAVVGSATGRALEAYHLRADATPEEFNAEALAARLEESARAGQEMLVVRAQEGREVLPDELRKLGAQVLVAPAYRTVRPTLDVAPLRARLEAGTIHAVAFASPSAVKNWVASFSPGEAARLLERVCIAAIGQVTAKAVAAQGLEVGLTPAEATGPALVGSLLERLGHS